MPRLQRNLHLGTTVCSADNAIREKTRNMKLREAANLLRLPHKSTTRHQNRRFLRVFARHDLKIDVSCEASVDFHHMSENATPATEFAPWHHFAQR